MKKVKQLTIIATQFKDKSWYIKFEELPTVHGWDKNKKKALSNLFECMAGYLEAFPEECKRLY